MTTERTSPDRDGEVTTVLIGQLKKDPRIAKKILDFRRGGLPSLTKSLREFLERAGVPSIELPVEFWHASREERIKVLGQADQITRARRIDLEGFEAAKSENQGGKPARARKRAGKNPNDAQDGNESKHGGGKKKGSTENAGKPPELEASAGEEDLLSFLLPEEISNGLYEIEARQGYIPEATEELRIFIARERGEDVPLTIKDAKGLWELAAQIAEEKEKALMLKVDEIVKQRIEARGLKFYESFVSPFDREDHPDKRGIDVAEGVVADAVRLRFKNLEDAKGFIDKAIEDLEVAHIRANAIEAVEGLLSENELPSLAYFRTRTSSEASEAKGFELVKRESAEAAERFISRPFSQEIFRSENADDYSRRIREVVDAIENARAESRQKGLEDFEGLETLIDMLAHVQVEAEDELLASRQFFHDIGFLIASGIKDRTETEEPHREADLSSSGDFLPPSDTGFEGEIPVEIEPHEEDNVLPPQPDPTEPGRIKAVSRHSKTKVNERSEYAEKTRSFVRRRRWLIAGVGGVALALIAGIGIGFMLDSDDKGDREFTDTSVVRETVEKVFDEKLMPINERLDRLNERINGVNESIDRLNERLDNLENDVNGIDDKLDNLAVNPPLGQPVVPVTSGQLTDDEAKQVLDRMDGTADGKITVTIDPSFGSGGIDTVDWATARTLETGLFHPENPAIDGASRWSLTNAIIDGDAAGNHWVKSGDMPPYGIEQDDVDGYQSANVPLSPKASGIVNELRTPPPQNTLPGSPNLSADINGLRESANIVSQQAEAEAEIPVVISQNIDQAKTDLGGHAGSKVMSGYLNFEAGAGIDTSTEQTVLNTGAVFQNPRPSHNYSLEARLALQAFAGANYGEDDLHSGSGAGDITVGNDRKLPVNGRFFQSLGYENDRLGAWVQSLKQQDDEEEKVWSLYPDKKQEKDSLLRRLYKQNSL